MVGKLFPKSATLKDFLIYFITILEYFLITR